MNRKQRRAQERRHRILAKRLRRTKFNSPVGCRPEPNPQPITEEQFIGLCQKFGAENLEWPLDFYAPSDEAMEKYDQALKEEVAKRTTK